MNDIFKKKSARLYIISQNNSKNAINKNFNPVTDYISIDKNCSPSQKISSLITKKLYNNDIIIPIKSNSRFASANRRKISTFTNKLIIFPSNNINRFKKKINNNYQSENEFSENFNELMNIYDNYKLKKYPSEKITNTTEIIHKKIRYHDLNAQTRKKSEKYYTSILSKNNKSKKAEKNNEEKSSDDPYITVYGVLFSKNSKKKKPNNLIVTNANFIQNKIWKHKNTNNISHLSLPWLIKNKNKSKNMNFFDRNNLTKSLKKSSYLSGEVNDLSKIKMDINENIDIIKNQNKKTKNLISYDMISIAGSDHGRIKINQDSFFTIPKVDNCENVKIFGIFDGHGDNGDKISKEIRDYFEDYYNNIFNNNTKNNNYIDKDNEIKTDKYFDNKKIIFMNAINNFKNINKFNYKNIQNSELLKDNFKNETPKSKSNKYIIGKLNKKIKINLYEDKKIIQSKISSIKSKIENEKINNIYSQLSSNNYSSIYTTYKKMDNILHTKYSSNNFCHLSGSTSLMLFLINSKNCNKIISTNLGDSKIISISDDNKIKELNVTHTPNNSEEKNRILANGGVINRMDWTNVGPLRIWYKNKKYPGLSITRSFGDFESDELGVISAPDVKEYDIDEGKIKIIVFATDGVWKFLTNDKIMSIVLPYYSQNDVNGACKKISETAIKLWNVKNPKGIADVTVFVLFFK